MKKMVLSGIFALLFITGCTTSIGLGAGAGSGNLSTSVSLEKQIKKDKKDIKNVKKNKTEANANKKAAEKRVKQVREDALEKTETKNEKITDPIFPRTKQTRN